MAEFVEVGDDNKIELPEGVLKWLELKKGDKIAIGFDIVRKQNRCIMVKIKGW